MIFSRMHAVVIIIIALLISVLILFIIPIWACSVAAFFGIIAIIYMSKDFLNERTVRMETGEGDHAMEAEIIDLEPAPVPDDSYNSWDHGGVSGRTVEQLVKQRQPIPRRNAIPLYMDIFGLDEIRATNLYREGYYNVVMIREADTKAIAGIKGINPTLARRIKLKADEI